MALYRPKPAEKQQKHRTWVVLGHVGRRRILHLLQAVCDSILTEINPGGLLSVTDLCVEADVCRQSGETMVVHITIDDCVTPIREIVARKGDASRRLNLYKFIYSKRRINNRHLYKCTVNQTVDRLLDPGWLTMVSHFDVAEWEATAESIWRMTATMLSRVPPLEIVLYPGFGRFNGRVYRMGKDPIIGGSPDFPGSRGKNLAVLLAHEAAHFVRWRRTGIPSENVPVFALLYEEGWATWFSGRVLPDYAPDRVLMSNLHGAINMPDPKGGYLRWCQRNLRATIVAVRRVLGSKSDQNLGRFFQCRRFGGADTPIRSGYFIGYKLFEMLSRRMTLTQLLNERPTCEEMRAWLGQLDETLT